MLFHDILSPLMIIGWQEVLRYHPLIHGLYREPAQDDVLPLAEPIIISDGTECSQVPIAKGQVIFASLYIYNRFVYCIFILSRVTF